MGSRFLAPESSFLDGLSRLLDFSGSLDIYNVSPDEKSADYLAQRVDWSIVGRDLREASEQAAQAEEAERSAR